MNHLGNKYPIPLINDYTRFNRKEEEKSMTVEKRRQLIAAIWSFCAIASATVSIIFNNAGMVSFVLAVIGVFFLLLSLLQELVLYKMRKK